MLEVRHRRAFALSLYLALSGVSGWEASASQYLCEFCVEGQGRPASEEAARWVEFLQDARQQMGLGLVGERTSTGSDGEDNRRKLYHVGSAEGTFMMDALMWKVDKEMQNAQNILRQSLMGGDLSMPTLPADDDGRSNSESFAKKLYEKYKSSSHTSKPRSKDVKVVATAGEDASGAAAAIDASGSSGGSVQATDKGVASTGGVSAGAVGATSSNGVKEGGAQSSGRSSTPVPDGGNQTLRTPPASPSEPPQASQQQPRQQQQQQQTSSVTIPSSITSISAAEPSSATTSQQSSAGASQTGSSSSAPASGKPTTSPSYATEGSGRGEAIPSSGMRIQDGRGGQYAATQDKNDLLFPRQGQQEGLLHGTALRGGGR